DNVNAAAVSMAVAAGGAVKEIKTTPLMQPDEGFDAMLLAQGAGYRPPGGGARGSALRAAPAVLAGFLGAGVAAVGLGLGVALGARHVEHALVRAGQQRALHRVRDRTCPGIVRLGPRPVHGAVLSRRP